MNYRPDEKDWMAYLYGELEAGEKEKFDQYLLENAEARKEFENFKQLRHMMSSVKDKEVIAPPIFFEDNKQRYLWNAPYFKMIVSIAASLLLIIMVGRLTDAEISFSNNEFRLGFGKHEVKPTGTDLTQPALTTAQVQQMINNSMDKNNLALQANWEETQQELDASIRKNLAINSGKIDQLVRTVSSASQEQIREYVAGLQTENMQLVKDYFQLSTADQKKYIENMFLDFAQYLQQQRNSDLQIVQTRLNSIEQNTDIFKQETEQILSSIVASVGNTDAKEGTKN